MLNIVSNNFLFVDIGWQFPDIVLTLKDRDSLFDGKWIITRFENEPENSSQTVTAVPFL